MGRIFRYLEGHIVMAIGKCTDVFRGIFWGFRKGEKLIGRGVTWEDLSMEEWMDHGGSFHCHGGREFQ